MILSCSPTVRVHRSCREKRARSTECGGAGQVQVFFPALRTLIANSFFKWTRRSSYDGPLPPRLPRTYFRPTSEWATIRPESSDPLHIDEWRNPDCPIYVQVASGPR